MASSLDRAQDVVWCDLCTSNQFLKSPAELHCKVCYTNLCQSCAGKHMLSKSSTKHDIVEYKLREAEPIYPYCQSHPSKKCELQCQQCQVPVCARCLNDSHQGHVVAGISALIDSQKAQIMQDNYELEKFIAPEYEKQDSELETKISEKSQDYDAIITSIVDHGQDWHKEVDRVVNKHVTDVQKDKRGDLGHLQKYQSEIKNAKLLIYQTIEKNKKILKSNDITQLANYMSKNDEFKQMPPRAEFLFLPSFQPIKIQGKELLRQFGSLSASIKSEIKGYTIKMTDHIGGALSLKELLNRSQFIKRISGATSNIRGISCVGSDEVLTSGGKRSIKRFNIHGKLLQKVSAVCRAHPIGLSVTRNGAVLYCDYNDTSVKMIQDNKIHTVIKLQDSEPLTVCSSSSSSGDILVLMRKEGNVKLVRYSGSVMKQEIQHDSNGLPLFSILSSITPFPSLIRYIDENRNQDICVQNHDHIVVVNQSGHLRFRYDGKHQANKNTRFTPFGIATDSKCQILIADFENNCVHVIDKDGQFLSYVKCSCPVPVSVDSQDRLWVGNIWTGSVSVFQYMK